MVIVSLVAVFVHVDQPTPASPIPDSAPATPCEEPRPNEPCQSITHAGREVRYALLRSEEETSETAIVDFGGPGVSILSGRFNLHEFRNSIPSLRNSNLLFIEEPWVRSNQSDECSSSLSYFYASSRTGHPDTLPGIENVINQCGISGDDALAWGFSPDHYASVVSAIEATESIELNGFLGYSFGSARLSYLAEVELDWIALIRPFPVGVAGEELLGARVEQSDGLLDDFERSDHEFMSSNVANRHLPVEAFDYASAELALGYLPGDEITDSAREIAGRSDHELAGRLSDSLWLRYGENSISSGYLAYLAEVCRIAAPWADDQGDESPVAHVLASLHAPCRDFTRPPGEPARIEATAENVCVVTSDQDPLVPDTLIRRYLHFDNEVDWLESPDGSHSAQDGTVECLESVGLSAE
ncbi:hypothetical protein [Allonocardiopsis opalescens]|uniref:hypothetical protein n=1 Tax=Allonocardiopsis opalescens TaxID=1144618 RepID=UPI0011B283EB|nr:hypothetical protein [Allonocardiopsis opalescens]